MEEWLRRAGEMPESLVEARATLLEMQSRARSNPATTDDSERRIRAAQRAEYEDLLVHLADQYEGRPAEDRKDADRRIAIRL